MRGVVRVLAINVVDDDDVGRAANAETRRMSNVVKFKIMMDRINGATKTNRRRR